MQQQVTRERKLYRSLLHYFVTSLLPLFLLSRPARIAARLPKLIFQIGNVLFHLRNFLLLGVDLRVFVADFFATVLLAQRFLRVGVVLHLRLLRFSLQNVEFLLRLRQFVARFSETLAPGILAV